MLYIIIIKLLIFVLTITFISVERKCVLNTGCIHTEGILSNTGCTLNNTGCTLNNTGCTPNNTGCTLNNTGCTLNNTGCTLNNTGCTLNNTGCTPNNTGCTPNNTGCTLNNTGCTLNNTGCTLNNTGCTLNNTGCTLNTGCTYTQGTLNNEMHIKYRKESSTYQSICANVQQMGTILITNTSSKMWFFVLVYMCIHFVD